MLANCKIYFPKEDPANQQGFTLIELLVTVAIIGILAATAVLGYSQYKKRAFDADALSGLRNLITGEEGYYVDEETYVATVSSIPGLTADDEPNLTFSVTANSTSFSASTYHSKGSKTYCYTNQAAFSPNNYIFSVVGLGADCADGAGAGSSGPFDIIAC